MPDHENANAATMPTTVTIVSSRQRPKPTNVYHDVFWKFAFDRQQIFYSRLNGIPRPWTTDPILSTYRFTNTHRASDRVSQYLIRNVIYRSDLSALPSEQFFRIILFKLFNSIATWKELESRLGSIEIASFDRRRYGSIIDRYRKNGNPVYNGAYIMPSTSAFGEKIKHRGHLKLLKHCIDTDVFDRLAQSESLKDIYLQLRQIPTLGPFLAFQFAIDLNYSPHFQFSEMDFVVPGPGAIDGISKCFSTLGDLDETEAIKWVADNQPAPDDSHAILLFDRPLQLIDVQNLFCEISKYTRRSHPEVASKHGRTRIKRKYSPNPTTLRVFYPPFWQINNRIPQHAFAQESRGI